MWLLRTDEGNNPDLTFRILPGNSKTVGRAPQAEFIVDAAFVSRVHCRITAGATEIEVIDLDSTNGTFVNGRKVQRWKLSSGDRVKVGRVEFEVLSAS